MTSNSRVIWQGRLADQYTLRVERTGEQQGVLYVLSPHEADLLVIGGVPLPSSGDTNEDDIAVWHHIAEQGIAKLAERRAESPPSSDPSWDEEEIRTVQEMIAAHSLDTFDPSDRQQANRAILDLLGSEVEAHPYLRFGQLLTILGIVTRGDLRHGAVDYSRALAKKSRAFWPNESEQKELCRTQNEAGKGAFPLLA